MVSVTLSLPFAAYFASMPKPEPIMLLAMALFATFYVRHELRFGEYWIFAGIAFGTKIAILPALITLAGATILADWRFRKSNTLLRDGTWAFTAFLAGLALAVPILIPAVAVFVVLSLAMEKISVFKTVPEWVRLVLRVVILAACVYFARAAFYNWAKWTFLNSGHGADSDQVNFFRWLEFFVNHWILAPPAAGATLLAGILGWLAWLLWRAAIRKTMDARELSGLALAFGGLALNAAIFIGVKRLWGMYLYPGSVLMIAGVLLLVDHQLSTRLAEARARLRGAFGIGLAAALSAFAVLYWVPHTLAEFEALSRRTDSAAFRQQLASYSEVVAFLQSLPPGLPQIEIMHSPILFPPNPSPTYRIREFWGPFIEWDKAPQVIVFNVTDTPRGPEILPDSANYPAFSIAREGYARHVSSGAGCQAQLCYSVERHLPNGGEILVRESPR